MPDGEKQVILVTGGAGFIGSHLCETLLREGNRVVCVDNFSTGHVRNIEPFLRNPDFQFLRLDINEPFDIESFPELEPFKVEFLGIQQIYHLAAPRSIKNYEKYRNQTLLTHSAGTRNILDIAVKYKASIVLSSSAAVYGSANKPVDESYRGVVDQLSDRAAYDEGKRFAETMFASYAAEYDIDAKIARLFRTYGPRMPLFEGFQVPDFVLKAFNGETLTVNGTEETQSTFMYVSDAVDGLMRLMEAEKGIGAVNFGSDENLKLADVARKVVDITESDVSIEFAQEEDVVAKLPLPDIQKAKDKLDWLPVVRVEDGLGKTVDYVQANKILLNSE